MNKKIIKIIISIVILVLGIFLVSFVYIKYRNIKENKLITEDTVFLCPGDEYSDGKIVVVKKDEEKYENEVCDFNFKGKYVCESNQYCGVPFQGQIGTMYVNYDDGIALIRDKDYDGVNNRPFIIDEPTIAFLYDFKNNKKISKEYDFYTILYEKMKKYIF